MNKYLNPTQKAGGLFLLLFTALFTRAQQSRFIYIQADNKQPFYVKIEKDGRQLSSSSTGYMIIPKLEEGSYNLAIGFPKNEWPEQHTTLAIGKKDAGYSLRYFNDKGWGLFNLQSMELTMLSGDKPQPRAVVKEDKEDKEDGFANMLSSVVNDPTIKQRDVTPENKPVENKPAEPVKQELKTAPVVPEPARPAVVKLGQQPTAEGEQLVYTDRTDTIRIVIPPAGQVKEKEETIIGKLEPVTPKAEEKPVQKVMPAEAVMTAEKKPTGVVVVKSDLTAVTNKNCGKVATDNDFILLRKKLIGESDEDDMVAVARKAFKLRCYSTAQVKNLAAILLKDGSRYQLMDAAYPYVSDPQNFAGLETLMTDIYFINRFRAMLGTKL